MFFKFIQPCHPQRTKTVPAGVDWQHEIKFDGFRAPDSQARRQGRALQPQRVRFGRRFPLLVDVLREFPARSAIIDGEIVANDAVGMPDFWRLILRSAKPAELHIWAFDLLALNRKDLRKWSLEAGHGRLEGLVSRFGCPTLLPSESFADGEALLRVAEKHGLEGVVSKRRDAPFRSGECRDCRKVKTAPGSKRTGSDGACSSDTVRGAYGPPNLPTMLLSGI